jgi:aquaporin Z
VEWKALPAYWITQVVAGIGAGVMIYVVAKGQEGWTATGHMAANGFWRPLSRRLFAVGGDRRRGRSHRGVPVGDPRLNDDRAPKGFAGLSIGLTLTLIHLISIPISNTSVNPARSTGVAFFNGEGAPAQLWVFWLAPLLGAAIAGIAYPYLFGRNEKLADRPVRDDALEEPATT